MLSFIFTIICLVFLVALILGLYFLFKANDFFFAKMKEYQNLSNKMFGEYRSKEKKRAKPKKQSTKIDQKLEVEDAEFREVR